MIFLALILLLPPSEPSALRGESMIPISGKMTIIPFKLPQKRPSK